MRCFSFYFPEIIMRHFILFIPFLLIFCEAVRYPSETHFLCSRRRGCFCTAEKLSCAGSRRLNRLPNLRNTSFKKLNLRGSTVQSVNCDYLPRSLEELDLRQTRIDVCALAVSCEHLKKVNLHVKCFKDLSPIPEPNRNDSHLQNRTETSASTNKSSSQLPTPSTIKWSKPTKQVFTRAPSSSAATSKTIKFALVHSDDLSFDELPAATPSTINLSPQRKNLTGINNVWRDITRPPTTLASSKRIPESVISSTRSGRLPSDPQPTKPFSSFSGQSGSINVSDLPAKQTAAVTTFAPRLIDLSEAQSSQKTRTNNQLFLGERQSQFTVRYTVLSVVLPLLAVVLIGGCVFCLIRKHKRSIRNYAAVGAAMYFGLGALGMGTGGAAVLFSVLGVITYALRRSIAEQAEGFVRQGLIRVLGVSERLLRWLWNKLSTPRVEFPMDEEFQQGEVEQEQEFFDCEELEDSEFGEVQETSFIVECPDA